MSFTCSGCGETYPDSGLTYMDVLAREDGEWHEVDEVQLCLDCRVPGVKVDDE